jgi:hypothetical protein
MTAVPTFGVCIAAFAVWRRRGAGAVWRRGGAGAVWRRRGVIAYAPPGA